MNAVKYRKALAVRVGSTPSVFSATWGVGELMLASTAIFPLANEAAHHFFQAGRLHSNTVVGAVCVTTPSSSKFSCCFPVPAQSSKST